MKADLVGIDLKLQRAHKHLMELYGIEGAFRAKKPYDLRIDSLQRGTGLPLYRVVAIKNVDTADPPPELTIVAGEALYQLRSVLDHLVYQLVIHSGHADLLRDSRDHQFPICCAAKDFKSQAHRTNGVQERFVRMIEAQQPFQRMPANPKNDPLWTLQTLSNTDKHRVIPTVIIGIDVVNLTESQRTVGTVQSPDAILEDQKTLFEVSPATATAMDAELHCSLAFAQAMSPHGVTLSVAGVVTSVIVRVNEIVDEFRPLLLAV